MFTLVSSSYAIDKQDVLGGDLDSEEQFAKEFIVHQACEEEFTPEQLREIYKISCDTLKVAKKLALGEDVVPPVIYHYGKKKYMLENADNGNIPIKVWNEFIMSTKTRYSYDSNLRNGLYGTNNPLNNPFGDSETYNWINEIHISSHCRGKKHVASLMNLYEQENFITWFNSKDKKNKISNNYFGSIKEFKNDCFRDDYIKMDFTGAFMAEERDKCKATVEGFISEADIKVIQDHAIKGSWYIKDRSCILNIRGSETDVVQMIIDRPELLHLGCEDGFVNDHFYTIVQQAISNELSEKHINADMIEKIKDLLNSVPIDENHKTLILKSFD
jgi:hypothetical protein